MTIDKIIQKEFESLEVFLANYDFSMQEVQADIFDQVISTLTKLPQANGQLIASKEVNKLLLRLEGKIQELIKKGQYQKEFNKLITNFDTIEEIRKEVNAYTNPSDKLKVFKANTTPIREGYVNRIADSLGSPDSFNVNITNPLKSILFEHSTLGMSVTGAAKKVFDLAIGSEAGGGILARYSGQIAHDALYQFTGSVDNSIGEFIGANDINYIGDIVRDSRPQCVRWVELFGGFIPGTELQKEINWAKKNGQGYSKYLPELTIENFVTIRGGHRCRHRALKSNGKTSDKMQEVEKQHRKRSDEFNKNAAKNLDEKSKLLYDRNKKSINDLVKRYGKE